VIDRQIVLTALRTIIDPEMGVNIVDLGLIYDIQVGEQRIDVEFTLTYPGCPIGPELREEIVHAVSEAAATVQVGARIVWEPLWGPERMSEEARLVLGYPI
jgi:metal-sulfur cluster biosynthetic enzyme